MSSDPVHASLTATVLLTFAETKLIKEAEHKLSVLKNMVRVNVLDSVVSGVDVRVAVLECGFKDERGWESVPCCGAVIRASVSTDTVDALDIGVLSRILACGLSGAFASSPRQ